MVEEQLEGKGLEIIVGENEVGETIVKDVIWHPAPTRNRLCDEL